MICEFHPGVSDSTKELTCRDNYWDNVGGSTLDAALENSARDGRVIVSIILDLYPIGRKS